VRITGNYSHLLVVPLRAPNLHHAVRVRLPLYVTKVEKEGRTREEVDQVIRWLTGFDDAASGAMPALVPRARVDKSVPAGKLSTSID